MAEMKKTSNLDEFKKVASFEPMLARRGMSPVNEHEPHSIRMAQFDNFNGSVVKTEDYIKLLKAYEQLLNKPKK